MLVSKLTFNPTRPYDLLLAAAGTSPTELRRTVKELTARIKTRELTIHQWEETNNVFIQPLPPRRDWEDSDKAPTVQGRGMRNRELL